MTSISIIIAAYNAEQSIRRCLQSVIAQENADIQMECLVIDDCSTDGTLEQMKAIVHGYSGTIRFRMLRHKTHRGYAATRNTGIQQSKGDYLMFVDAPDQLMPGCMDVYTENLMRYWDTEVIAGNVYNTKSAKTLIQNINSPMVLRCDSNQIRHEMIRSHLYLYSLNKLVRRDLILNYHVYFDESLAYADLLWCYELFAHVTSMVMLPDVTYSYERKGSAAIGATERRVNALLASYAVTCDKILDNSPRPQSMENSFYVDHQLFVFGILSAAFDIQSEFNINSQVKRELSRAKSKLVGQTRNDGHKLLSMYFMVADSPFGGIQKLPKYRHYGERVDEVVSMLALIAQTA